MIGDGAVTAADQARLWMLAVDAHLVAAGKPDDKEIVTDASQQSDRQAVGDDRDMSDQARPDNAAVDAALAELAAAGG